MRLRIAGWLATAAAICFFGSFALIWVNTAAILPALGMFVASLFLGPLSLVMVVTSPVRLPQYDRPPSSLPAPEPEGPAYHGHLAAHDMECEGCGREIEAGNRYFILWSFDNILGHWSDTDAPRVCDHCASIREHADALGVEGVNQAFACSDIVEQDRDEMLDYLLAKES